MYQNLYAKASGRALILLLALALAIMPALTGCGKKSDGQQDATTASLPTEAVETEQTTEYDAAQTEETTTRPTQTTTQPAREDYAFRNRNLLNSHYKKHGIEMGFDSPEEYQAAASAVINNPAALTKIEKEDGDSVFYVVETNEFVVLSTDGYIRTYFLPDGSKRYFDKQ